MPSISKLIVLLVLLVGHAAAVPVLWTLDAVFFGDGGTATGSFVYDATTNTFSSVNITTTAGSLAGAPGAVTFISAAAVSNSNSAVFLTIPAGNPTGTPFLFLTFTSPLTNSGGISSLLLDGADLALCSNPACSTTNSMGDSTFLGPARQISNGHVIGTQIAPTPIPSSLILVLSGLFAVSGYLAVQRVRTLTS
jgi:hypothetical protein